VLRVSLKRNLPIVILLQVAVCAAVLLYFEPIAQDQAYHAFADQRTIFGIPNFWNVISNLPFAFVGALGLARSRDFVSRLLFTGVFLTALGSAYYHWSPGDARLVWDRLPMTLVFMSLLAMVAAERFPSARHLLIPLVLAGIASVVWWRYSGDLRPYALVQFAPAVIIPTMLLMQPTARSRGLWWVILFYGLAKVAEAFDAEIYSVLPLSGHTLKHFLAAASTWFIARTLFENNRLMRQGAELNQNTAKTWSDEAPATNYTK
jgi:multisubunit Na+/H+ antiporter MnhG subunit